MFGKLFKLVLFLGVVAFVALVGFAYFGDLSPSRSEQKIPVTLNVD